MYSKLHPAQYSLTVGGEATTVSLYGFVNIDVVPSPSPNFVVSAFGDDHAQILQRQPGVILARRMRRMAGPNVPIPG